VNRKKAGPMKAVKAFTLRTLRRPAGRPHVPQGYAEEGYNLGEGAIPIRAAKVFNAEDAKDAEKGYKLGGISGP